MYFQHSVQSHVQPFLIAVTGEGEISVQPDSASINLGVMTEGKDLEDTQQQNSTAVNNIIQALIGLGIPRQLIQTFDYRITTQYDFEQGKQLFRGYKVIHLLQVKIADISLAGKIIDDAVQQGANYVADVQFSVTGKDKHYRRALSLSLNDALQKANVIAATLKVTLDPYPVQIIEGNSRERPLQMQPGTYVKGISTLVFEPGQLKIQASVTAYFHFHP